MMMGAYERRIKVLQIAASMKRRLSKDDPEAKVEEVIEYAKRLDEWVQEGK